MEIAPAELIPDILEEDEAFARAIFTPYHLKSNGRDVKPNAFRSVGGVSVNRTKFCTGFFCKRKAKTIERLDANPPKIYKGFAVVTLIELSRAGGVVRSSKQADDSAHADIYYLDKNGYEYGQPQSAEVNSIIDAFISHIKYFADPNSGSNTWEGEVFWTFRVLP